MVTLQSRCKKIFLKWFVENVQDNIFKIIHKRSRHFTSKPVHPGAEDEGCHSQRHNLGSLSRQDCCPPKIPAWDQAVHQVGIKMKQWIFFPCRNSYDNDLFFAMRGAGSSFGIATEFLYVINRTPETEAAVILVWINDMNDLWRIQEAAYKTNRLFWGWNGFDRFYLSMFRFSIAINNEFAGDFWNSFKTRIVYKFLPTLLTSTKILHRWDTNLSIYRMTIASRIQLTLLSKIKSLFWRCHAQDGEKGNSSLPHCDRHTSKSSTGKAFLIYFDLNLLIIRCRSNMKFSDHRLNSSPSIPHEPRSWCCLQVIWLVQDISLWMNEEEKGRLKWTLCT